MSTRNRHLKYRKSIYKKRRLRATVIITVSAIVLAFTLFIIFGTLLHSKTQPESDFDSTSSETDDKEGGSSLKTAPTVNAYALPLLMDGSRFSERLDEIEQNYPDASDVCINLNLPDGTLLYDSELSKSFSNIEVTEYASSLENSLSDISDKDYYTTATLYIPSFSNDNDLEKEVELAIWGAIACEVLREGIDDLLILAPDATPDDIQKLSYLADMVHENVSGAIVGFTLSDSLVLDEDRIVYIDELKSHFNYLAVDMATSEEKQNVEYIEDLKMQSMIIRHNMRILLPHFFDTEIQNEYITLINQSNFINWQVLPQS